MSTVRATFGELRDLRRAWERDVAELFDDFDTLAVQVAVQQAAEPPVARRSPAADESAAQHLLSMRDMMIQQTELLAAFIGAATRLGVFAPTGQPEPTADDSPSAAESQASAPCTLSAVA